MLSLYENTQATDLEVDSLSAIMDPWLTGSSGRAIRQVWSQSSQKIEELGQALVGLKQSFSEGVFLQNAFISTRTLEGVEKFDV